MSAERCMSKCDQFTYCTAYSYYKATTTIKGIDPLKNTCMLHSGAPNGRIYIKLNPNYKCYFRHNKVMTSNYGKDLTDSDPKIVALKTLIAE